MCELSKNKTTATIAPLYLPQAVTVETPEGEDMPLEVPVDAPEEVPVP